MKASPHLALRETKRMDVILNEVKLNGVFSGYASLFDVVDQAGDAVAPGAFTKSLRQRTASGIRMLYQHDPDQPIGIWTSIVEDTKGLLVEGRITSNVGRAGEVLSLMREGAIDGLSIGFKTKRASTHPVTKVRRIIEADLWEISIVTFPLLDAARIDTVKGGPPEKRPTIRELERWLTRDAGLSRRDARCLMAKGYHALGGTHDAARPEPLADMIRRATQTMNPRKHV
ncbi:MAG: HK97 family phage prohead protease [Pseudomonadota bacterium]